MEMDRKTIKALASDTRVDILKALVERRKMPAEISKQMQLAPSTIVEHLKLLESAGLVEKKHTGHKWIYYELTSKGKNVAAPKFPINMILILTLGIIVSIFGFSNLYASGAPELSAEKNVAVATQTAGAPADLVKTTTSALPEINWIFSGLFVLGLILIIFGLWKIFKKNSKII